jgi:hypothetical protein
MTQKIMKHKGSLLNENKMKFIVEEYDFSVQSIGM